MSHNRLSMEPLSATACIGLSAYLDNLWAIIFPSPKFPPQQESFNMAISKQKQSTNSIGGRKSQSADMSERKNKSRPNQTKPSGKKPLPGPTHVGNFLMMLLMKICRTILFVDTSVKIGIYLVGVMAGSAIADLFIIPKTVMADKKNILNVYFVKMGWGWTLTFVGIYVFLTTLVYCCRDYAKMCQHAMRLAVGTFWWYICTKSFNHIENATGFCSNSIHGDKVSCIRAGKNWFGFDISGHIFLEIHCLLIISEELKSFKDWRKLGILLEDEDLKDKRKIPESELTQAATNYKTLTPFIKIVVIFITVIFILFEFMLIVTTVYRFHTLAQKVAGSLVAVVCWFLSYRVFFRSGNPYPFFPTAVGESRLAYMKVD